MPDPRSLLHPTGSRWVCDLCGQPLAGPDDHCNSGLHQGPDDLNGFRGSAIQTRDPDPCVCWMCEGEGQVLKNAGINSSGRPAIVPCPLCEGEDV